MRYYLLPVALPFLNEAAEQQRFPYSQPPASRTYRYDAENYPNAYGILERFIRWSSFCDRYEPHHCEQAASIVRRVADENRR